MELLPDESCDMLVTIFPQIGRDNIANILRKNNYQIENTMEEVLSEQAASSSQNIDPNTSCVIPAHNDAVLKVQSAGLKPPNFDRNYLENRRGSKITLAHDFLRVPGWQAKHREATARKDFMTLFADPVFLSEVEREFGPDYESILREHIRVENEKWAKELEQRSNSVNSAPNLRIQKSQQLSAVEAATVSRRSSYGSGAVFTTESKHNSNDATYWTSKIILVIFILELHNIL